MLERMKKIKVMMKLILYILSDSSIVGKTTQDDFLFVFDDTDWFANHVVLKTMLDSKWFKHIDVKNTELDMEFLDTPISTLHLKKMIDDRIRSHNIAYQRAAGGQFIEEKGPPAQSGGARNPADIKAAIDELNKNKNVEGLGDFNKLIEKLGEPHDRYIAVHADKTKRDELLQELLNIKNRKRSLYNEGSLFINRLTGEDTTGHVYDDRIQLIEELVKFLKKAKVGLSLDKIEKTMFDAIIKFHRSGRHRYLVNGLRKMKEPVSSDDSSDNSSNDSSNDSADSSSDRSSDDSASLVDDGSSSGDDVVLEGGVKDEFGFDIGDAREGDAREGDARAEAEAGADGEARAEAESARTAAEEDFFKAFDPDADVGDVPTDGDGDSDSDDINDEEINKLIKKVKRSKQVNDMSPDDIREQLASFLILCHTLKSRIDKKLEETESESTGSLKGGWKSNEVGINSEFQYKDSNGDWQSFKLSHFICKMGRIATLNSPNTNEDLDIGLKMIDKVLKGAMNFTLLLPIIIGSYSAKSLDDKFKYEVNDFNKYQDKALTLMRQLCHGSSNINKLHTTQAQDRDMTEQIVKLFKTDTHTEFMLNKYDRYFNVVDIVTGDVLQSKDDIVKASENNDTRLRLNFLKTDKYDPNKENKQVGGENEENDDHTIFIQDLIVNKFKKEYLNGYKDTSKPYDSLKKTENYIDYLNLGKFMQRLLDDKRNNDTQDTIDKQKFMERMQASYEEHVKRGLSKKSPPRFKVVTGKDGKPIYLDTHNDDKTSLQPFDNDCPLLYTDYGKKNKDTCNLVFTCLVNGNPLNLQQCLTKLDADDDLYEKGLTEAKLIRPDIIEEVLNNFGSPDVKVGDYTNLTEWLIAINKNSTRGSILTSNKKLFKYIQSLADYRLSAENASLWPRTASSKSDISKKSVLVPTVTDLTGWLTRSYQRGGATTENNLFKMVVENIIKRSGEYNIYNDMTGGNPLIIEPILIRNGIRPKVHNRRLSNEMMNEFNIIKRTLEDRNVVLSNDTRNWIELKIKELGDIEDIIDNINNLYNNFTGVLKSFGINDKIPGTSPVVVNWKDISNLDDMQSFIANKLIQLNSHITKATLQRNKIANKTNYAIGDVALQTIENGNNVNISSILVDALKKTLKPESLRGGYKHKYYRDNI
jgi:hypothetical protein